MTPEEREMLLEMPAVHELLAEEREACAKIVESTEEQGDYYHGDDDSYWVPNTEETLHKAAATIRARTD